MTFLSLKNAQGRKRLGIGVGIFAVAGLLLPMFYLAAASTGVLLPELAAGTWPTRSLGMLEYGTGVNLASFSSFGGNALVFAILGIGASVIRPALLYASFMLLGATILTLPAMLLEKEFLPIEYALAAAILLSLGAIARRLSERHTKIR